MTVQRLFAEIGHAFARGWIVMMVLACVVAVTAYSLAALGSAGLLLTGLVGFMALWASVRASAGLSPLPTSPGEGARLAVSLVLKWLILGFLAIMTLLAVTLCTLAIMAGAGFDFEASGQGGDAADAAMAAFQATPGWQLAQVAALLAALLMLGAIARGQPIAAASVQQQRIVAMHVFNQTRGQAARLLLGKLAVLYAPLGVIFGVGFLVGSAALPVASALCAGIYTVVSGALSTASLNWLATKENTPAA